MTHFNEVDECAGVDGLITDRVWCDYGNGEDPSNTLHDVRWGAVSACALWRAIVWFTRTLQHANESGVGKEDLRASRYLLKQESSDVFVWVMEISGAVPTSHFEDGYKVRSIPVLVPVIDVL